MSKLTFKISLLDDLGYPIQRFGLSCDGEISEDSVRDAIEKIIPQITEVMVQVQKEEETWQAKCKASQPQKENEE
jgi:hypothetical protein